MRLLQTFIVLTTLALSCMAESPLRAGWSEKKYFEWPELVGKTGEEAKEQILKDKPDVTVYIIPDVVSDLTNEAFDRVFIFVDEQGKVVETPRIE